MTEIICLKAKAYFYKVENEEEEVKKLKGVSRATLKKQIHFENALDVLNNGISQYHKNYAIRNKKFETNTIEQNKKSLSSFDNKRYLLNNIETLPYCDNETKENIIIDKVVNKFMEDNLFHLLQNHLEI